VQQTRYRYMLERTRKPRPTRAESVTFIGLNPSTADETHDDPTIRRCIGFMQSWGYQRLIVVNLFALRATQPADLRNARRPIGPNNDAAIAQAIKRSALTIVCWGNHGNWLDRDQAVLAMLNKKTHCLQINKSGAPAHPLYQPASREPLLYTPD